MVHLSSVMPHAYLPDPSAAYARLHSIPALLGLVVLEYSNSGFVHCHQCLK